MKRKIIALAAALAAATGLTMASTASAAAPTVSVAPVQNVTATSATMRCTVDNGGLATTKVWVTYKTSAGAWGPDTITTAQQTASTNGTYSFPVTGLTASTSYDQRC